MSAIWGVVDFNPQPAPTMARKSNRRKLDIDRTSIKENLGHYKIDVFDDILFEQVYFGCGLQHLTEHSIHEQLPYHDMRERILFTADCVLDNREYLIKNLKGFFVSEDTPDGMLIYKAYLKWGVDCVQHIEGAYAFAVYDFERNRLHLFVDPVYERCLYIYESNNCYYFSTLIKPIQLMSKDSFSVNEDFIADGLSIGGFRPHLQASYTGVKGIHKVMMGHYYVCKPTGLKKHKYYHPDMHDPKDPYQDIETTRKQFREIMDDATRMCIHDPSTTGIGLSAGLDSTTVCSFASDYLAQMEEDLKTYTFIPTKEYTTEKSGQIINESIGPKLMSTLHPNLDPRYADNQGKDALMDLDSYVSLFEMPVKFSVNMPSLANMMDKAYEDGCRTMLFAQFGNLTISQGGLSAAYLHYLKRLDFESIKDLINGFQQRHSFSRRRMYRNLTKDVLGFMTGSIKDKLMPANLDNTYVSPAFAKATGADKRVKKSHTNFRGDKYLSSLKQYYSYMYEYNPMMYLGEINTKWGLIHGIIIRDPSKNKRVIEYTRQLPMACFVNEGLDRWLIRGTMKDLIPEDLLYNIMNRGVQSADSIHMLKLRWSEIIDELTEKTGAANVQAYIDRAKVDKALEELRTIEDPNKYDISMMIYIASISQYIEAFNLKQD